MVLGIPVGALEPICRELMARDERFRRGIERAVTVQTQAFQVWANRHGPELGWTHEGNSVAGCYVEPIDTYCDMTHLIPREDWKPGDDVRTIAYLCGVLEDRRGETQDQATERVHRNAVQFLERDMPILWPDACRSDGSFDWDVLVDPEGARVASASTLGTGGPTSRPPSATCSRPRGQSAPAAPPTTRGSRISRWPGTGLATASTAVALRPR